MNIFIPTHRLHQKAEKRMRALSETQRDGGKATWQDFTRKPKMPAFAGISQWVVLISALYFEVYRGPDLNRHGACAPQDFKSCASTNSATPANQTIQRGLSRSFLRRRADSNRRIKVLQTSPLPLGYGALSVPLLTRNPTT